MNFKRNLRNRIFLLGVCLIIIGIYYFYPKPESIKIVSIPASDHQITQTETAKVIKVYDGDTIEIGDGEKVRYIGIDSAEVYPQVQCFSQEAKAENEKLVLGKEVTLIKDVSETDKYGRLLRYVYIVDPERPQGVEGLFVNDFLVRSGFAKIMSIPPDTKYKDLFIISENHAKENNLGLWRKCF